uniref:At1g61320/AtMIF1 LRR domain-containing protein n=1 Tax=Oryza meridionalis TaxID=40149 RepID=A0A0E0D0V9_9ORYZ
MPAPRPVFSFSSPSSSSSPAPGAAAAAAAAADASSGSGSGADVVRRRRNPADIWSHIHSLMPLRDASRAACVSRAFLRSWRCHPNLIFRIEEITLVLPLKHRKVYSFPCSLLFGGSGRSLRYLDINGCSFRPMVGLCLRSLTKLRLCQVRITGDELECLLANTIALKELELMKCSEIIFLKVPLLKQLSYLNVFACNMLQMIEIKALNLSAFNFTGSTVQFSLGQLLRVKDLNMTCLKKFDVLCYVITKLPYVVPNVETLVVSSITEEYMNHCSVFDDASPMRLMTEHKKHKNLKNVTMIGFCSAKSMVELTCHILESTTSLECITLDTIASSYENEEDIIDRCCVRGTRRRECLSIGTEMILEAHRAILAIERYILGKVPAAVRLDVHRPCTRCHTV